MIEEFVKKFETKDLISARKNVIETLRFFNKELESRGYPLPAGGVWIEMCAYCDPSVFDDEIPSEEKNANDRV